MESGGSSVWHWRRSQARHRAGSRGNRSAQDRGSGQYARVSEMAARFRQTADAVLQYLDDMGRYSTEEIERFRQKKDYYRRSPASSARTRRTLDTCDRRRRKASDESRAADEALQGRDGSDRKSIRLASRQDVSVDQGSGSQRRDGGVCFADATRREMYQGPPINTAQFGYRVEAPQEGSVKIFHKTVDDQGVATVETEHWMFPEETRASPRDLAKSGTWGSSGSLSRRRRG